MLHPGLYEQVINNALTRELSEVPEACKSTAPIDTAEASKVLAQYLTEVVQKGLDNVQDNGGGIPPKLLPVLFSGTLRHSDTPTGDGKRNMGLGLSVCNAIVRAHGGTMHAQNRDGGAEFIFCLPMIEKEPELQ